MLEPDTDDSKNVSDIHPSEMSENADPSVRSGNSNHTIPADTRWVDLASVADSKVTDMTEDSCSDAHPPRHLDGLSRWVVAKPDSLQETDARVQATLRGSSRWLSATPSAQETPMHAETVEVDMDGSEASNCSRQSRQQLRLYMQADEDRKQAAFETFGIENARYDGSHRGGAKSSSRASSSSADSTTASSDMGEDLQGESIQYAYDPESEYWSYELEGDRPDAIKNSFVSHSPVVKMALQGADKELINANAIAVPRARSPLQVQQILETASLLQRNMALQTHRENEIQPASPLHTQERPSHQHVEHRRRLFSDEWLSHAHAEDSIPTQHARLLNGYEYMPVLLLYWSPY